MVCTSLFINLGFGLFILTETVTVRGAGQDFGRIGRVLRLEQETQP
jgi:hypothetical protein